MYTFSRVGPSVLLSLVLLACGGGDGGGGPDSTTPVSSQPLSGTVAGRPFTAVSAIAFEDMAVPGDKLIQISEVPQECTNLGDLSEGRRDLTLVGPWNVHSAPLSLENILGVIVYRDEKPDISLMVAGRVEFIETPTAVGALGTLRVRGANSTDSVEGEVSVRVCE
ncbi:hypothetical protein POL68_28725 [Stigmatella sp. ncwal1]|uniref:Lipoprotein n=1 Tax=Stigmatella ashevillensis TaxID=2995309 RepID=A0ABT5DFN6_9BACT|nr:hypothetical protein [Stigmatella ashevillena]MDC0712481.1 hypothetical protein [Stigmatella ashevillena]